jgi:hypothetical protein
MVPYPLLLAQTLDLNLLTTFADLTASLLLRFLGDPGPFNEDRHGYWLMNQPAATPERIKKAFREMLITLRTQVEQFLGDADKARKNKIDRALEELMAELETAGQLETRFSDVQIGTLFDVLRKANDIARIYDFLTELFGNEAKYRRFFGCCARIRSNAS